MIVAERALKFEFAAERLAARCDASQESFDEGAAICGAQESRMRPASASGSEYTPATSATAANSHLMRAGDATVYHPQVA